jgi:hypothetical protein
LTRSAGQETQGPRPFRALNGWFEREVVPTLPGLDRREATRSDDGEWVLVLRYGDMESPERGPEMDTNELSGRFIAIDLTSMSAGRAEIVSE